MPTLHARTTLSGLWRAGGAGIAGLLLAMTAFQAAAQNVLWEDYRGTTSIASDANYIGPQGAPRFVNNPATIANLSALANNPANAVRTGTSALVDYGSNPFALCDSRTAANLQTDPCRYQAMGRVMYTLVRFPVAGTYTLSVAHDDSVQVSMSSSYTSTAYRTANYDIPVGALSSYTSGETDFRAIGSFNADVANSCALMRIYWVNAGGLNFNRLRWQHPAINGGAAQIIPATQFSDPSQASSSSGCAGSIVYPVPAIMVNKVVNLGRIAPNDQFTVSIRQGNNTLRAASTSGAGTGQQASTGALQVSTGNHVVRDDMAANSVQAIGDYDKSISCTSYQLNGQQQAYTPSGTGPDWTIAVAANTQYTCTITNTPRPVVTARKISERAVGAFTFTGTNGLPSQTLTTTSAGQAVAGSARALTAVNTATTLTEAQTPGFALSAIQCTGLPAGVNGNVDLPNRSVTLPAAAIVQGANITCTFTNAAGVDLSVTKTNAVASVPSGSSTTYSLQFRNGGPGDAGGAVLKDTPTSGLSNCQVLSCTPTNNATCPQAPADLLTANGATVTAFPANSQINVQVQCSVN